jgi:5-enolpyruvylshikimate-3-phosphate synthase
VFSTNQPSSTTLKPLLPSHILPLKVVTSGELSRVPVAKKVSSYTVSAVMYTQPLLNSQLASNSNPSWKMPRPKTSKLLNAVV